MNNIEVIIFLLLLFMAVPDLCRKLRRPALAYSVFVLFGLGLGPLVEPEVATMLRQAGQVGFLLLLFEVGLEIELPKLRDFQRPLKYAAVWSLAQFPLVALLAWQAGLDAPQTFLAATAVGGCSVGIAHSAWKSFRFPSEAVRQFVVQVMVALELLAIVAMAVGTMTLREGVSAWILLRLLGIGVVVVLLARYATIMVSLFQRVIDTTTHWRLHWLALLILAVCAAGQRLGLDAAKTAFVLGLCMSRAKHRGMNLEEHMAPLSRRFLIPLFFVSLGLSFEWKMLVTWAAALAVGAAGLLLGVREVLHRRWLPTGGPGRTFLLFSPNLSLVALAANALIEYARAPEVAAWLLMAGLFITVPAILLLPADSPEAPRVPSEAGQGQTAMGD